MSLTVVGSIAFDAVETETGKRDRLLGGSAVHFSLASSFFADTRVVGPVGDDFGQAEYDALHSRGVITDDIEHVPGGKTFFWAGRYERDVNLRHTLQTDLNVFEHFQPSLSEASAAADVVFLANIQPDLQREVREQCTQARFVAMDSMNLWIDIAHESLLRTISLVDGVILNDGELKQLTDEPNLVRAAHKVLDLGPSVVVAKQGEYGSALFTRDGYFALTAYPTPDVIDPTGRGRLVRRRLHGLHRRPSRGRGRRRPAAARHGLRDGARLLQRRGLRPRAHPHPHGRGDRGARRRAAPQLIVRRRARRAPLTYWMKPVLPTAASTFFSLSAASNAFGAG